jgi:D-arabinose 1-dehydrogenase-like Zn-dependent alcohol dehydrogenase
VEGRSNGIHKASTEQPPYKNVETVALVVEKPKDPFKLEPIVLDEVRENELLIDMKYSGICYTVSPFLASTTPKNRYGIANSPP